MGVDYSANYGIGYKISVPEHHLESDQEWMFEEADLPNGYEWFESGSENYDSNPNDIYICITNPFESGYDLTEKKAALDAMLKEKNILPKGDFGAVGGLHIH